MILVVGSISVRLYIPGKRLMRCGRISVEGEAEEIAVSPTSRYRLRHERRENPYSTSGLDKFESVYAELSARREYIAKKTGVPPALVRFSYSKNGWVPVVARAREVIGKKNGGVNATGVSILGSVEKNDRKEDWELRRKDAGNDTNGECQNISTSVVDERSHSLVMPWSRFFHTAAIGVLSSSAMWVRRLAVTAVAAITVVITVGRVMCTKAFCLSGVSSFARFFRNPRNLESPRNGRGLEAIAVEKEVDKFRRSTTKPGSTVRAPSSPLRAHGELNDFSSMASPRGAVKPKVMDRQENHLHQQSKDNKWRRVVSMDNRPTRRTRLHDSDSFYRRRSPTMTYSANLNTTALIITLFCLVFYGRLSAILFTCVCWYLLPL